MKVAIIADDLTGAADTGVQFAAAGYRTVVAFLEAPVPSERDIEVVAVDTDSRALPPDSAAKRVLEVASAIKDTRVAYKKIDSTLRGPVAAELVAALKGTGRNRAVVAPAFPSAGRTTKEGVQLVGGVPVHETDMKNDPRTPVREGHFPTLLAQSASSIATLSAGELTDHVGVRRALEGASYVVADAESDSDLEALVRAVPDPSKVLWVGSAGLAFAFGKVYPGPHAGEPPPVPAPVGRVLVVVGSLTGIAREQLRRFVREFGGAASVNTGGPDAVEEAVDTVRIALSGGARAAVYSDEEGDFSEDSKSAVEALAEVVASVEGEGLFDALILTGGDTAVEVAQRLGATGIRLEGEIEPGIPFGTLVGPSPYPVVTKAGGFGEPDTLARVVETLLQGEKG